jgi:hypothetical protein
MVRRPPIDAALLGRGARCDTSLAMFLGSKFFGNRLSTELLVVTTFQPWFDLP